MTGYGADHQAVRRALLPYWVGRPCVRCGLPMTDPADMDLDHTDDRTAYRGFAHSRCNRKAGSALGHRRKREKRARLRAMADEVAVAVEISEDRAHTSVVSAGHVGDTDIVLVELVAYLDGTDAVEVVVELRRQRKVRGVVVDPMSNAATLLKPLREAGVKVTEPSVSDVKVAHGAFLDLLAAGRFRHGGQPQLTAAAKHLSQRRLGEGSVWNRRGAAVDVSPAIAAELACWGLANMPPVLKPMVVAGRRPGSA